MKRTAALGHTYENQKSNGVLTPLTEMEVQGVAKDGTNRGGARVGAGRKSKALADKINTGSPAMIMELPEPQFIEGADGPPMKDE